MSIQCFKNLFPPQARPTGRATTSSPRRASDSRWNLQPLQHSCSECTRGIGPVNMLRICRVLKASMVTILKHDPPETILSYSTTPTPALTTAYLLRLFILAILGYRTFKGANLFRIWNPRVLSLPTIVPSFSICDSTRYNHSIPKPPPCFGIIIIVHDPHIESVVILWVLHECNKPFSRRNGGNVSEGHPLSATS